MLPTQTYFVFRVILAVLFAALITLVAGYADGQVFLLGTCATLVFSMWVLPLFRWAIAYPVPFAALATIAAVAGSVSVLYVTDRADTLLFGPPLSDEASRAVTRELVYGVLSYCASAGSIIAAFFELVRANRAKRSTFEGNDGPVK